MPPPERDPREAGYEPDDLRPGRIVGVAGAVAGALLLVLGAAYWLTDRLVPQPASTGGSASSTSVTGPRLQPRPQLDWQAHRAEKRRLLNGYDWVDPEQGVVRIPIERAMQRLAERGKRDGSTR